MWLSTWHSQWMKSEPWVPWCDILSSTTPAVFVVFHFQNTLFSPPLFLQLLVVLGGRAPLCLRWTCCRHCVGESRPRHTMRFFFFFKQNSSHFLSLPSLEIHGCGVAELASELRASKRLHVTSEDFPSSPRLTHASARTRGCPWQSDKMLWSSSLKCERRKWIQYLQADESVDFSPGSQISHSRPYLQRMTLWFEE